MICEYFSINVFGDRPGENNFFEIASFSDEQVGRVAVGDAHDVLFDDRAGVEVFCNIMTRGADNLDTACKCLMIRFRADKGWQK